MLTTLTSYLACFIIPLLVGALALAPFRFHVRFGLFTHWLIFSLVVIYVVRPHGTFELLAFELLSGMVGFIVGIIMILPAIIINAWGTASLLASLGIKEDWNYLWVYPTFFIMGYSSFTLGLYSSAHFRLFPDKPGTSNWQAYIFFGLLTISPALIAGLERLFQVGEPSIGTKVTNIIRVRHYRQTKRYESVHGRQKSEFHVSLT